MGHLASPEADRYLDLVSLLQKLLNRLGLEGQIVLVGRRPHPDLFEQCHALILARFALFLLLLKLVPTVVEETTDRRDSRGGNFDEIQIALAGEPQGLVEGKNTKLLAILTDDSDVAGTDTFVDAEILANRLSPRMVSGDPGPGA